MRRIWRPAGAAAALAAALAMAPVAGCGGSDPDPHAGRAVTGEDSAADSNGSNDADGDDSGSGSGDGDGSGVENGGSLPDDWPGQFPDPPAEASFNGYLGAASADRSEYLATYTMTGGRVGDLHDYYQEALTAAGWEQTAGMSVVTETTTMTPFAGFGAEGSVTIQQDQPNGPVTITIIMHVSH